VPHLSQVRDTGSDARPEVEVLVGLAQELLSHKRGKEGSIKIYEFFNGDLTLTIRYIYIYIQRFNHFI
jgi:hypothetical protein